jgi:hypothetical protein
LLRCDLCLKESLRIDQVANRLSLGKIDPAIQKCSHRELAGLGESRTASRCELDNMPQNDGRSMSGDFDHVIGRIRMRLGEVSYDHFVDTAAFCRHLRFYVDMFRFHQFSKRRLPRLKIMLQTQHGHDNTFRLRPCHTDHAYTTATRRCGNSDDRIVEIHSFSL